MRPEELERIRKIEKRVREIFLEEGLKTTEILFEIVPSRRMLEAMSYRFPTNFSHWSFGRDFEKNRTIYEHTGGGIPYEQVWNFDVPKAYLVETNPFALNVTVIAHVFGHVDFFLANCFLQKVRALSDTAEEARNAARRFRKYAEIHGEEVEKFLDAAFSLQWHQHPDPFHEEVDEEIAREYLLSWEKARLESEIEQRLKKSKPFSRKEKEDAEKRLRRLENKTPPYPVYDLLYYLIRHSPRRLRPWQQDLLEVVENQARALSPLRRTKLLDEGWAAYWHTFVMRKLTEEGLITPEEHGTYSYYQSRLLAENKRSFNWYRVGYFLFEYIRERWDKGQFGKDYEESKDPLKRANWDTKAGLGKAKVFQVRENYSDRMAIEEFFTDEFIHEQRLYIYETGWDSHTGEVVDVVVEDRPWIIRGILKQAHTLYGIPIVRVEDGNFKGNRELLLVHEFSGFGLDQAYLKLTLANIHFLWGRSVHLDTVEIDEEKKLQVRVRYSFDGKEHKRKALDMKDFDDTNLPPGFF